MRVILVDDDIATVDFLTPFLELKGFQFVSFIDAREALKVFTKNPQFYDAAILDMCMPEMMGTEAAKQMRLLNPRLEFLFFTGLNDRKNIELAQQYGAYLHKPPWPDDVFNALGELVTRIGQHTSGSSSNK